MSSLAYMDKDGRCYWLPQPGTTLVKITFMGPVNQEVLESNPDWSWWGNDVLALYNDKVWLHVMFEDGTERLVDAGYLRWHVQSSRSSPLKWKLNRSPDE